MKLLLVVFGALALCLACGDTESVWNLVNVHVTEEGEIANSTQPDSSPIRLAFWNIRIFSDGSRDDNELQLIASVMIDYDFIAIAELRDELVLRRIERVLNGKGRDYDYIVSQPVGASVKERYAFLYDQSLVNIVEDGEIYVDSNDDFLREPYFATFKAGQFDFTAIVVHVIWGKSVGERQQEVQELADVYNFVQDNNGAEQDVILFGDFNRNPDDGIAYQPLKRISGMINLFQLPKKSHIKDTSLYDNIFFQSIHVTEYTGKSGIDRFDETDFGNNDKAASLAVSDHRPVWADFRTDKDDDGGNFSAVRKAKPVKLISNQTVYVTRTGKKYHLADCHSLKKSKRRISLSAAKQDGYIACKRCSPAQ